MVVIHVVDIHYWYTRTSAYGISLYGFSIIVLYVLLSAAADLTEHLFLEFTNLQGLRSADLIRTAIAYLVVGSVYVFSVLPIVFMAKTLFRLELEWNFLGRTWRWVKVKVPVLRRMRESHKERSSARLDRRTNWRVMASVSLYSKSLSFRTIVTSNSYTMAFKFSTSIALRGTLDLFLVIPILAPYHIAVNVSGSNGR